MSNAIALVASHMARDTPQCDDIVGLANNDQGPSRK